MNKHSPNPSNPALGLRQRARMAAGRFAPRGFATDQRGATAIEYALIAALVAVVIIGALTVMGTSLQGSYQNTTNAIDNS